MTDPRFGHSVLIVPADEPSNDLHRFVAQQHIDAWEPWIDLDQAGYPGVSVRVSGIFPGRVTITGVRVERPEGVRADDLRVPIERIEAVMAAQLETMGIEAGMHIWTKLKKPPAPRELRLTIPTKARYPDSFYERVASLYRRLVAAGEQPAPRLADANGVARTTTHRWIREARRRGLLPPGQTGRAG